MGKTSIEWTDNSWNPVTGCAKISPGCKHCYAESIAKRFWGDRQFTDVLTHEGRLGDPLRWSRPRKVFVNSMSDLFHPDVPFAFIDRVFAIMSLCYALDRGHIFQILTKRPERAVEYLSGIQRNIMGRLADDIGGAAGELAGMSGIPRDFADTYARKLDPDAGGWPLPNVWLGVSVENQEMADRRIPCLLNVRASVRFLSCEPLLGPIDLSHVANSAGESYGIQDGVIDWVICGGESGPNARPCNLDWIDGLVNQCSAAGVPVFVKQLGSRPYYIDNTTGAERPFPIKDKKGGYEGDFPCHFRRELPIVGGLQWT